MRRSQAARAKGRETLTRDDVIRAATDLLDETGAEAVSMRDVARKLGVGVSTLYWHVRDQRALWTAIVEASLRPLVAQQSGPWEERFARFLRDSRTILAARPALLPWFWSAGWEQGPETLRVADVLVSLVAESGIPEEEVAGAYHAVLSFVAGFLRLEALSPDTPPFSAGSAPGCYPNLARYRPAADRAAMDARYEEGTRLLIAGLRSRARQRASGRTRRRSPRRGRLRDQVPATPGARSPDPGRGPRRPPKK